jgi:hypothetical protein
MDTFAESQETSMKMMTDKDQAKDSKNIMTKEKTGSMSMFAEQDQARVQIGDEHIDQKRYSSPVAIKPTSNGRNVVLSESDNDDVPPRPPIMKKCRRNSSDSGSKREGSETDDSSIGQTSNRQNVVLGESDNDDVPPRPPIMKKRRRSSSDSGSKREGSETDDSSIGPSNPILRNRLRRRVSSSESEVDKDQIPAHRVKRLCRSVDKSSDHLPNAPSDSESEHALQPLAKRPLSLSIPDLTLSTSKLKNTAFSLTNLLKSHNKDLEKARIISSALVLKFHHIYHWCL